MAKVLTLKYLPDRIETKKNGMSQWWLGRKDGKKIKFPTNRRLIHIFRGVLIPTNIEVKKRFEECVILLMPTGLPKVQREAFLDRLEKRIGL